MKTTFDTTWYVEQERRIAIATALDAGTRADRGYVYVVEFTSGVVKVGKAANAKARIATHAAYARIHGGDVRRSWVSVKHRGYDDTERSLIAMCRQLGVQAFGKEYFRDVRFESACEYASEVIVNRKRREYLDRLIEAVGGDLSVTWQAAHLAAFGTDDVTEEVA